MLTLLSSLLHDLVKSLYIEEMWQLAGSLTRTLDGSHQITIEISSFMFLEPTVIDRRMEKFWLYLL